MLLKRTPGGQVWKESKTSYPLNSNYNEKIVSKMGIYTIVYAMGASPLHRMLSWLLGLLLIAKCPYYSMDLASLVRQGQMLIFLSTTYSFLAILSYIIYDRLYVSLTILVVYDANLSGSLRTCGIFIASAMEILQTAEMQTAEILIYTPIINKL